MTRTHPSSGPITRASGLVRCLAAAAAVVIVAAVVGCSGGGKTGGTGQLPAEMDLARQIELAQNLAVQASKASDPKRAIELYQRSVQAYSQLPAVWNNLGVLLMEDSRRKEADEAFATAAELAPSDPRPHFNRGLLRFDAKRPDEARIYFTHSLDRDPNYLPALRGAIECDVVLRRFSDETLEMLNRAMFLEQDKRWRERMELQRARVESYLEDMVDAASTSRDRRGPVIPAEQYRRRGRP